MILTMPSVSERTPVLCEMDSKFYLELGMGSVVVLLF